MLAAKRRLRVAPVPPQAADLTRPARVAGAMPGRDEGTGASIEPRNNHDRASGLAVTIPPRLQSFAQWWVRLNYASHTEIRILPFGHGKKHLAAILVSLNLLAFAVHTICDIGDELWRAARAKLGPRYNFFSKLAAITTFLIFPSWDDLLLTLAFAKPPPIPP